MYSEPGVRERCKESKGQKEQTLKERYQEASKEQNQRTTYERYRCNWSKYPNARRTEPEDHLQVQ